MTDRKVALSEANCESCSQTDEMKKSIHKTHFFEVIHVLLYTWLTANHRLYFGVDVKVTLKTGCLRRRPEDCCNKGRRTVRVTETPGQCLREQNMLRAAWVGKRESWSCVAHSYQTSDFRRMTRSGFWSQRPPDRKIRSEVVR